MKKFMSKWTYMLFFLLIGDIILMNIALKLTFKESFVLLFLDGSLFFAIVLWICDIMNRRTKKKSPYQ